MLDLHTHSLLSDGVLLPLELIRRAQVKGCQAIAVTDHADTSNLEQILPRIIQACRTANQHWKIKAIPGIELTHFPPAIIPEMAQKARRLGAKLILVHGETIVEPVIPGTNRAALESEIDILAHPGLITLEEAELAKEKGIFLELSSRQGHCLSNGQVAKMAIISGASLVLNTDAHTPEDLISREQAERIAHGAGLNENQIRQLWQNAQILADRC